MRERILFVAALAMACSSKPNDSYCDQNTPCLPGHPDTPFCDLTGAYPASNGVAHVCIAAPSPDASLSMADAAPPDADPSIPTMVITDPAGLTKAIGTTTYTIKGTAADGTGPLTIIMNDTDNIPVVNAQWSTTVTLSNTVGCPNSGRNQNRFHVVDSLGRSSSPEQTVVLDYDNCPPQLSIVAHNIYDERQFEAGFKNGTFQPCLYIKNGAAPTVALDASGTATTFKYALNAGSSTSGVLPGCVGTDFIGSPVFTGLMDSTHNPITWLVKMSDVNPGQIHYKVLPSGPVKDVTTGVPGTNSLLFSIEISKNDAPLDTQPGVYQVTVTGEDRFGNAATPITLTWTHHVLGGPIYLEDPADQSFTPSAAVLDPTQYGLAATAAFYAVDANPASQLFAHRYLLHNGTPYAATATLAAQAASEQLHNVAFAERAVSVSFQCDSASDCTTSCPNPYANGPTVADYTVASFPLAVNAASYPVPASGQTEALVTSGPYGIFSHSYPSATPDDLAAFDGTHVLYGAALSTWAQGSSAGQPAGCVTHVPPNCTCYYSTTYDDFRYLKSASVTLQAPAPTVILSDGLSGFANPQPALGPFTYTYTPSSENYP